MQNFKICNERTSFKVNVGMQQSINVINYQNNGLQHNVNVVNHNDVLCGRSRFAFDHPGNAILREKIASALDQYNTCSRKGKTAIIRDIVDSVIRSGGRFLKFDDTKEQWYDGGFQVAKVRVSTAFRDARSSYRKANQAKGPKKAANITQQESENEHLKQLESNTPVLDASFSTTQGQYFGLGNLLEKTPEIFIESATPNLGKNDDGSTWSLLFEAVDVIDIECASEQSNYFPDKQELETTMVPLNHEDILGRDIKFKSCVETERCDTDQESSFNDSIPSLH